MEKKEQAVIVAEQVHDIQQTPSALLALAVQKDLDIEKLTKLMDLHERWEKNEAKKQYVAAITAFKQNPPKIVKDMHVEFTTSRGKTSYNHASLGNVVASITEGLSQHQLTVNWSTQQTNGDISVTCSITHVGGHSENTNMTAPPDDSGGKNRIQAIGSTISYLQRYTLLAIVGLATNEFEDDGRAGKQKENARPKTEQMAKQSDVDAIISLASELKEVLSEESKTALRKVIHVGMTEQVCAGWKATLEKIKAVGNRREESSDQPEQETEEPKPEPEITDPKLSDPMIPQQRVGILKLLEQIKDVTLKAEWETKVKEVKTRQQAVEMIMQLNRVAHPKNGNGKTDSATQEFIDKAAWFRAWLKQRDMESEFLTVLGGIGCEKIEEVQVQDRKAFQECLEGIYEDTVAREMKEKKEKTADATAE